MFLKDVRIHYVITNGGAAPNVVPEFAESYYYVRHPDPRVVAEVFERVKKAAEGAALGRSTTFDYEVINGVYSVLPNDVLGRVMDANLRRVGPAAWTAEEMAFAEQLQRLSLGKTYRRWQPQRRFVNISLMDRNIHPPIPGT